VCDLRDALGFIRWVKRLKADFNGSFVPCHRLQLSPFHEFLLDGVALANQAGTDAAERGFQAGDKAGSVGFLSCRR